MSDGPAGASRKIPPFDLEYCVAALLELLSIPSPSGHTARANDWLDGELSAMGLASGRTGKGALWWTLEGTGKGERAVTAHIDTLGAMVKEIKEDGRLRLSQVGGFDWETVEGAECLVHVSAGEDQPLEGTLVCVKQSVHVFDREERAAARRNASGYELRLDLASSSREGTAAAGVQVGDFVSFQSRPKRTPSGHVKGRHLDDKACVAVALAVTRSFTQSGVRPACNTHFFISNYEEVSHGAAGGFPGGSSELLCLDMAAVGKGQASNERAVTLCLGDSGGPYDFALSRAIGSLAGEHGIDLRRDLYPHYRSDATAAWRAGATLPAALIGPGVDSSHGHERTHEEALEATGRLLGAYLLAPLSTTTGSGTQ